MKKLLTSIITVLLSLGLSISAFAAQTVPATGGIGTKIFYIVGGVLAVVALIFIIVRSRMSE